MIVIDASALVAVLLGSEPGQRIATLLRDHLTIAPDTIDTEVLSALKTLERGRRINGTQADEAASRLVVGPIRRYPTRWLAREAWGLRHNLSVYDAMYVALAQSRRVQLVTLDRGMAESAREAGVLVTSA